jgi:hypothetical protein
MLGLNVIKLKTIWLLRCHFDEGEITQCEQLMRFLVPRNDKIETVFPLLNDIVLGLAGGMYRDFVFDLVFCLKAESEFKIKIEL